MASTNRLLQKRTPFKVMAPTEDLIEAADAIYEQLLSVFDGKVKALKDSHAAEMEALRRSYLDNSDNAKQLGVNYGKALDGHVACHATETESLREEIKRLRADADAKIVETKSLADVGIETTKVESASEIAKLRADLDSFVKASFDAVATAKMELGADVGGVKSFAESSIKELGIAVYKGCKDLDSALTAGAQASDARTSKALTEIEIGMDGKIKALAGNTAAAITNVENALASAQTDMSNTVSATAESLRASVENLRDELRKEVGSIRGEIQTMEVSFRQALSSAVEMVKGFVSSLPAPQFMVPPESIHVDVGAVNLPPLQVENIVPPPRLVEKSFEYDAAGRPLRVVEREIENQGD